MRRSLQVLPWLARWAVVATFAAAALPKILEPSAFADDLANYRVFPHWSWNLLATTVPALEIVAAAAFAWRPTRRAGAWLLGGLLLAFVAILFSVILRGIDVSCGCFGGGAATSTAGWPEVYRDLGLAVAVILGSWDEFGDRERGANPIRSEAC